MPTYVVSTARGLSAEQRAGLFESITAIHATEADAPRYFVQVVFNTLAPGSIFIGGNHCLARPCLGACRYPGRPDA